MRLIVEMSSPAGDLKLPIHYNHMVQSVIYKTLDHEFASFLHEEGYDGGGRRFKLFTFSRLIGEYKLIGKEISFGHNVKLVISSPVEKFCQSLLNGLLTKECLQLGRAIPEVTGVQVDKPIVKGDVLRVRLLSPVVAYSTLLKTEGTKYTCYYQPGDGEFERVAGENLRKKYRALFADDPPTGRIEIRCLKQPRLHILQYKGVSFKAYSGLLELKGPRELLQIALDVGLGSKNSMGFGCIEMLI